jgi:4-diphosphocytidyl-2-C-methyl-D-erythritol kinase
MAVSLHDTLDGAATDDGEVRLSVISDGAEAPADESNLVLRATQLLRQQFRVGQGASLTLTKRVPAGRGLGGGSSDGAAALVLLSALWELDVPEASLADLAARLGSDVPFFLGSPLAVMKGRGEIIEPVDAEPPVWVVLVVPPFGLATRDVYAASTLPLTRPAEGVSLGWLDQLRRGHVEELDSCLVNDLEPAARALCSSLETIHDRLREAGARCVLMTGSGSAVFALAATRAEADSIAQRLQLDPGTTSYVLAPWRPAVTLGKG